MTARGKEGIGTEGSGVRRRYRNPQGSDKGGIALERIYRLFELAKEEAKGNPERSRAYIELCRKVSSRNRARIPKKLKHSFCKKCNSLFTPRNSRSRVKGKWLNITCLKCGKLKRVRLEAEKGKKAKRA